MSSTRYYPLCPTCKYNLSGLTPDEIYHVRCPECGDYINPISTHLLIKKSNERKMIIAIVGVLSIFAIIALTLLFLALMIDAFNF